VTGQGDGTWLVGSGNQPVADAWLWLTNRYLEGGGSTGLTLPRYAAGARDLARFNIVGEDEIPNDTLVLMIARAMGVLEPKYEFVDFHSSRPGHDLRYALDGTQLAALGWKAPVSLGEGIERTVAWTLKRPEWL